MCKDCVSWLYRAESSFRWSSGLPVSEDRVFFDSSGKVRLVLEVGGWITVTRGYSWNGCSPKICLFDILWGTPDGVVSDKTGRPKTYFASMVHDALYQFLRTGSPFTRRQADRCFLRLMAEGGFSPRYVYWAAVRLFGWLVWKGKSIKRQWRGSSTPASGLLEGAQTRASTPASS